MALLVFPIGQIGDPLCVVNGKRIRLPQVAVYAIRNLSNDRCYVGWTIHLSQRLRKHRGQLFKGRHENPLLQADWNFHGCNVFVFEVLEILLDESKGNTRERLWIKQLNASTMGYNQTGRNKQLDSLRGAFVWRFDPATHDWRIVPQSELLSATQR